MCLPFKPYLERRHTASAARKAEKLEKHDHQRWSEDLLRIALKKVSSVNSLTHKDPAAAVQKRREMREVARREGVGKIGGERMVAGKPNAKTS